MEVKADIHIHSEKLLPEPFRTAYRTIFRKTIPEELKLEEITKVGVQYSIVNVVGDNIVTKMYSHNGFSGVLKQINIVKKQIEKSGTLLYEDKDSIFEAQEQKKSITILGVEGGDFINNRTERIKKIYELGVRALTIVHFSNNCIGKKSTSIAQMIEKKEKSGNKKKEKKQEGLSNFGKKLIEEVESSYPILLDLAHANLQTVIDTFEIAQKPLLISHSGLKSIAHFSRYISDRELYELKKNEGLLGLWPYFFRGKGMMTYEDFCKHARYAKEKIGSKYLAIGTDINGMQGIMDKFNYRTFYDDIKQPLSTFLFKEEEIKGIIGENFLLFLKRYNKN